MSCYDSTNCCDPCKNPASYDCQFDISVAPFDSSTWFITWCGKVHKVKVPKMNETDTKLSADYSNATLNYQAEKHTDIITGEQLGNLINIGDLRDVDANYDFEANCAELIYHRYGECGQGCRSLEDKWGTFALDDDGAKQNQLMYVRGANVFGCPVYLDVPSNTSQYWFAGWRQDTQQFGYYQAPQVPTLPKLGKDYIVMSLDPTTKQPVWSTLPLDCLLGNIMGNTGMEVFSTWSVDEATEGFDGKFNNMTGDFVITWNDWIYLEPRIHCGTGKIYGSLNWSATFNTETGNMEYYIPNLTFTKAEWTIDQGMSAATTRPTITVWGVPLPSGDPKFAFSEATYGDKSWSQNLNVSVPCNYTAIVPPGQTLGPLNFVKINVDWTYDDTGFLQINFKNKINGWNAC